MKTIRELFDTFIGINGKKRTDFSDFEKFCEKTFQNDVVYIIDYFDPKHQIWYGPREFDNLKTAKAAFEIYKENFSVQLTKVERHFEVLDFCQKISHESS